MRIRLGTSALVLSLIAPLIGHDSSPAPQEPPAPFTLIELDIQLSSYARELPDGDPAFRRVQLQAVGASQPRFPLLLRRIAENCAEERDLNRCFYALKAYWNSSSFKPATELLQFVGNVRVQPELATAALALLASNPEPDVLERLLARDPELKQPTWEQKEAMPPHFWNLLMFLKNTTRLAQDLDNCPTFDERFDTLRSFALFVGEASRRNQELDCPDQAWARRRFRELSEDDPDRVAQRLVESVQKLASETREHVWLSIGAECRSQIEQAL
ncbi:MAG: hypothetical protein RL885_22915 [Planctomycetota bacterium]